MLIKQVGWFAVAAAVLGAVSPAAARSSSDECVFDKYEAVSVAPLNQEEDFGLGSYTRLRGAQLYIAAQPGLTAEWLTVSVRRELAKHSADSACRPSVRDVNVSVISAGAGFWVTLSTPDDRAAAKLLAWARGIVPAGK